MRTETWSGIARHWRLPTLTGRGFQRATGCWLNATITTGLRPTPAGPGDGMPSGYTAHAAPPA
jgi:hypothetical protein